MQATRREVCLLCLFPRLLTQICRPLKQLCDLVREILVEESNVHPVSSPVSVCGDVHGQFYDVLKLFRENGEIPDKSYVFMGDFVDRGNHSVETLELLFAYKARHPDRITLFVTLPCLHF